MGQAMKPKLSVYLSDRVAERLTRAASRPGSKNSANVYSALDRFLNPERDQSGDGPWWGRTCRQFDQTERDLSITTEAIALFVSYDLIITPPLPSGDHDDARALGRERFEMFVAQIGRRVAARGGLMVDAMERVVHSNRDLSLRNLEEGAPLGEAAAAAENCAREATGQPPKHFQQGQMEIGDV
jgi:hypothetical protein